MPVETTARSAASIWPDLERISLDPTPTLKPLANLHAEPKERCFILELLPNELLTEIACSLCHMDPKAHCSFALVCKQFHCAAFSPFVYRSLCHSVFQRQVYPEDLERELFDTRPGDERSMVLNWGCSWERMMRERAFLKYEGCYVSKVRYLVDSFTSGGSGGVKECTYWRYLRFFPDGSCVKLQSIKDPPKVLPSFNREKVKRVFKEAVFCGFFIEENVVYVVQKTSKRGDKMRLEELFVLPLERGLKDYGLKYKSVYDLSASEGKTVLDFSKDMKCSFKWRPLRKFRCR